MSLVKHDIHPGQMIDEFYLTPLGMAPVELAAALHVSEDRIAALISGKADIDVDLAFRLARYWATTADYWMKMQMNFDVEMGKPAVVKELDAITPYPHADVSDAA